MNITFVKLKGLTQELKGIRLACERLAACWEAELADRGHHMSPPRADTSGPPPELLYVNEEADALRELEEALGLRERAKPEEED